MRLLSNVFLLLCVVFAVHASDEPELAPADRLKALLTDIRTLHATFVQTSREQTSRGQDPQAGEVWLEKPNLFRLETIAPLSQTIVSDGESLWTYDRDLEQVIISSLSHRVEDLPILLLAGEASQLVDEYRVDFYEDETRQYFVLYPLEAESILSRLSIAFEAGTPVSVGVDTATQQRTIIDLTVIQNEAVAGERFEFVMPEGADVIDDRIR